VIRRANTGDRARDRVESICELSASVSRETCDEQRADDAGSSQVAEVAGGRKWTWRFGSLSEWLSDIKAIKSEVQARCGNTTRVLCWEAGAGTVVLR